MRFLIRGESGRPEEFHLQSPSEPCVNLSIHTAPASIPLETSRSQADAEKNPAPPPLQRGWPSLAASWLIPFAPAPLQDLQHYYWIIRPLHVHRYFPPSWVSLILTSSITFRCLIEWFACARLPEFYLPRSDAATYPQRSPPWLFNHSSLRWFEACSCKPAPRGPPSSSARLLGALHR